MPDLYAALSDTLMCRHQAWEVALDRVELDLVRAEQAIETGGDLTGTGEWRVPDYYGPIPVALRPRAEEIVERQRVVLRRLAEQLDVTVQHQTIVDGVAPHSIDPAIYVDVNA